MNFTLYHYWRSSSSWRVRWALALKGIKPKFVHVGLLDGASESAEHLKRNPQGYVPVLEVDGKLLTQSVAIIEWLEENFPKPQLFPGDSFARAHIRALIEIVNADTQPIQNLTVMDQHSSDEAERKRWNQFFIRRGMSAYEELVAKSAGRFSVGDSVTAADLYLVPQFYNSLRFEIPATEFPVLARIYENALKLPECAGAHPDCYQPK